MKKSLVSMLLALSFFAAVAIGAVGCEPVGVCTDNAFVLGAMTATLYYPCTGGPYPATTMTSGFMGTEGAIEWLAEDVAAADYVVLAMTPANPLGMVSGWRDAHQNGVRYLKGLSRVNASKVGTCGHSKGGGGALWAADNLGSGVATAIGMAPWQEQFLSLSGVRAATLIQAGSLDSLATGLMTRNEYNSLPSSISRAYFEYASMGHMAWATGNSTLSRDVIAWLDYYMKNDKSAASNFTGFNKEWVDRSGGSSSGSSGGCN